jgi:hypothetical protein
MAREIESGMCRTVSSHRLEMFLPSIRRESRFLGIVALMVNKQW